MARNVFYSFHYVPDCHRASQVRNIGVVQGNVPAKDNDWETVTRGGDAAIKNWIDNQLKGTTCTVVLIGAQTAGRKWITYEIEQSWNRGNGVVGIHIHQLKDLNGRQSVQGANPFSHLSFNNPAKGSFANVVCTYNPWGLDSKQVYGTIATSLGGWVEEAIRVRSAA